MAIVAVLIALVFAGWMVYSSLGSDAARSTRDRTFIDSTTGKPFSYTLRMGDKMPVRAPSGQNSGYPAEMCYWTKDGKPKSDPTPVLLNTWIGKSEPTFCPDCGRLVVPNNPGAVPGATPPPTREEFASKATKPSND